MSFIVLAVLMILFAAACVAVPLWRARPRPRPSPTAANRAVHAARLEELERDLAAGRLAPEDYAAARHDLEADLHTAMELQPATKPIKKNFARLSAAVAALVVMLAATGLYLGKGDWRPAVQGDRAASVGQVEAMVAALAQRLATTDQDDLQGWIMLGRSYGVMGRYTDAENAYARARQLSHDNNAEALAGYAEVLTLLNPDQFATQAAPLFERALRLDPDNTEALWYGGLAAVAHGDKPLAVQRWQKLLTQNPPADFRAVIEDAIARAGGAVTPAAPAGGTGITLRVTLAQTLRVRVQPDEALFVFARPVGEDQGPPLAVRRLQAGDLPLSLTLTDADAMVPGRKLSDYPRLTLTARISLSGSPLPQPGDLQGQVTWQQGDAAPALRIDSVVKP